MAVEVVFVSISPGRESILANLQRRKQKKRFLRHPQRNWRSIEEAA
jgi:hypothetical protein